MLKLAIGIICCAAHVGAEGWSSRARTFLEPLTYADKAWRADDFGTEVSLGDQALLDRFRPKIFIGPRGLPPIDFYKDYLPSTVVLDARRSVVREKPDRAYLKSIERTAGYHLDFRGDFAPCRGIACRGKKSVLYGRVYRESLKFPSDSKKSVREIRVLKYSPVFAASGLPARLPWYKTLGARIAGDLDVWHELDIHGALHLLIERGAPRPFAALFAQHNHFRTYIIGVDIPWPEDGRIAVCYAERSNEPYPCPEGREPAVYRTIGSPANIRYLIAGGRAPAAGGEDVVYGSEAGGVALEYELAFLPDRDPLYVSWIPLGDRMKIMGFWKSFYRRGPPGMNMNTWPKLRRYADIAQFWYMKDGDERLLKLYEKNIRGFDNADLGPVLEYGAKRFWQDMPRSPDRF